MKFHIHNANIQPVVQYLQKLPEGKEYDVTVERHKVRRTMPQNALYWLWIQCIASETGGDKEQIHEELKVMYLPTKRIRGLFDEVARPMSTTALDTKQFTEFLEKVQVFASSELGIVLPTPDDLAFEQFESYYQYKI